MTTQPRLFTAEVAESPEPEPMRAPMGQVFRCVLRGLCRQTETFGLIFHSLPSAYRSLAFPNLQSSIRNLQSEIRNLKCLFPCSLAPFGCAQGKPLLPCPAPLLLCSPFLSLVDPAPNLCYNATMKKELLLKIQDRLSEMEGLVAAYVFGSSAQGIDHRLSDVDIALLFDPSIGQTALYHARVKAMALVGALCRKPVDVVILNHASPLLAFQVIKTGRLIVEHNRTQRCLFQMRACNRYYDLRPYLEYHLSHVIERIRREGLGGGYHGHRDALEEARRISAALAATPEGVARGISRG